MRRISRLHVSTVLLLVLAAGQATAAGLLNVSYDVARGLYQDLNRAFVEEHARSSGETVKVDQSHGGSSKQARAVIDGLGADVVTMNSPLDIDVIADAGLLPKNWAAAFPERSSPSWSTIVFVVRKGNPRRIADWPDLTRADVKAVLPNPKTSGNGRYSYLAAWHYARSQPGATDQTAIAFEQAFFRNVPVLDIGGRDATTTFAHRGIGDVLLTFESEAKVIGKTFGADRFEIVYPSISVRADNPVAVVEKNAARNGTTALAEAYLKFHYGKTAQTIFAGHGLRTVDPEVAAAHAAAFPPIRTFTVEEAFGGWPAAQATHFASGGHFDRIIAEVRK
ncbi:MAG TPA: sulfate ABC transporter substrate-binding protein [Dokdonella sp.]|uniref:sulfate ABC transporter substrate-binding protein n=1 Tax=Dokdonella sp. TaxID=2291710 RepID=UPI002B93BB23|nr:sulfate ABC transporter substrate-binding protein [Dokdonella sp.]HUD43494.1 sulfate ABC transporter substrate-binding protein [Dokdonella sp.]